MLRFLRVRHLAVIDEVEVEFGPGLNVLTGETGAGKSILVGAVGLLLGDRASPDLVRTGAESATIEAIFETDGVERLIRREVTAQGRSRAFVNGELATAGSLKELASSLIELHGQHEHHVLLDSVQQLNLLDACGRLDRQVDAVADAFEAMQQSREELARAQQAASDRAGRQELLSFQLGELDRASLQSGEDERLSAERLVLASAERLARLCEESYDALYDNDQAVLSQLGGVWRRLAELATIDAGFAPYLDSRDAIKSQLEDLALFLRRYADGLDASPARLQQVEDRLALVERLKRKYGPSLADVIARREGVRRELDDIAHSGERSHALDEAFQSARAAFVAAAEVVSVSRRRIAAELTPALERLLAELAMDRTVFEVRFNEAPLAESEWTAAGFDRAEFFVSPNPGEELRPLARIVSGGELSRIMLAIKTLAAGGRHTLADGERAPGAAPPGLIFDEIDAGIGGRAADVVGRKLRALGSAFQVLCITHLPQIAAHADTHFAIEKRVDAGRTRTSVARLDQSGRVDELARMLGGEGVTDTLRVSAREMLSRRQVSVTTAKGESESNAKGESETTEPTPTTKRTKNTKGPGQTAAGSQAGGSNRLGRKPSA